MSLLLKKNVKYQTQSGERETEISYIPVRFILAILLAVLETVMVITIVVLLCMYVPYFYLAVWATEIGVVVKIIASNDNPDYKIPWLMVVMLIPVGGLMLHILFYSRTLKPKFVKRLDEGNLFVPGVVIGIIGMMIAALGYPIHKYVTKKERAKVATKILKLTDELIK